MKHDYPAHPNAKFNSNTHHDSDEVDLKAEKLYEKMTQEAFGKGEIYRLKSALEMGSNLDDPGRRYVIHGGSEPIVYVPGHQSIMPLPNMKSKWNSYSEIAKNSPFLLNNPLRGVPTSPFRKPEGEPKYKELPKVGTRIGRRQRTGYSNPRGKMLFSTTNTTC